MSSTLFGVIGSIINILLSIVGIFLGFVGQLILVNSASTVTQVGCYALILSTLVLIGTTLVKNRPKLGSTLMSIGGIGVALCVLFFNPILSDAFRVILIVMNLTMIVIPSLFTLFKTRMHEKCA